MTATARVLPEGIAAQLAGTDSGTFRSVALPDSFDPTGILSSTAASRVVGSYERPSVGTALVAVGEAGRAAIAAGEPFEAIRKQANALLATSDAVAGSVLRPRLLGGFAFDLSRRLAEPWIEYASAALVLPRLLFVQEGAARGVVLAPGVPAEELESVLLAPPQPSTGLPALRTSLSIDREAWLEGVRTIAGEIRSGAYVKAVLATTQQLTAERRIEVSTTLAGLRVAYPDCHLFSVRAGESVFLGASPELLVSLRDGLASALGLAGSARRGATPDEDERLGQALLWSSKNREEHHTVVRAIREGLGDAVESLEVAAEPRLRRLRNIQHLATEVAGRVRPGVDILELVRRLHPTPAVCGWPRDVARRVIARIERFDRGWYAGPVGWLDAHGEGEFAVALRSALVRDTRAWLFAGNGIMGDSDPEAELAEVQLKFRPLAEALSGRAL